MTDILQPSTNQITRGGPVLRQLENVLSQECNLYSRYIEILDEENAVLRSFTPEKMDEVVKKREKLTSALEDASSQRKALLARFPEGDKVKLSHIIAKYCHPDDVKRVMPLVLKLKELIELSRSRTLAHQQSVSFSTQMVNGLISILWSAGQQVSKLYGRTGKVEEKMQPPTAKAQSTLKKV